MKFSSTRTQRGQAMSEFIVAMAVFVPLVMGVIYVGKYSDIKHQAIQASRYAAMERALDPSGRESDLTIAEETRARFFTDGSRNGGKIGFEDKVGNTATSGSENPLWSQMNGKPMITQYSGVSVKITQKALDATLFKPVDAADSLFGFKLQGDGQVQADVEVPVANISHFAPLKNINLKIAATTVMAGDAWNAGGTENEAKHFTFQSVPLKALGGPLSSLKAILDPIWQMISGTDGPQFGCVRPDVVPRATAPGAQYSPGDKCY